MPTQTFRGRGTEHPRNPPLSMASNLSPFAVYCFVEYFLIFNAVAIAVFRTYSSPSSILGGTHLSRTVLVEGRATGPRGAARSTK